MPQKRRSAKSIIDSAIRENQQGMILLYLIAITLVLAGASALIMGIVLDNSGVSWAGTISSSLCYPSMLMAWRIRKENVALRLLEAPLARADTAKQASEAIYRYFVEMNSQPPESLPVQPQGEPQV